ncbi:ABC transporter ATP-binding protein [Roseibium album]|uniref:Lipoprotein-releasing system ATP-binding protein LolD n=1 Tax=Roseibium album TaxID=311410 RepID=A0A0M7AFW8_9HYPH|nr:ABC transporter ATP-binding protein [Roseibium album]CTQ61061.1 Lipoprotein-releasing system ATP-binding protein LolD [Roseibium album]CTQ64084.1 Lipoprotein-releasing system ATP-binding protein LolD [Roseibium album]CTQ72524.1 Lipoprotein-releasing system ATP-binding protein LolD [Roseibium album]
MTPAEAGPTSNVSLLLQTRKLTRILPAVVPVTLVQDVDISIGNSEFVAITGPSGSGKSSLLYLLGLLDKPTSGGVLIEESSTSDLSSGEMASMRLAKIGFVFQFHFLLPEFTALENIMIPMQKLGRLSARDQLEHATGLLVDLGLQDFLHRRPAQLSGGQRQRVAVARALANSPDLILADEPTGSLDSAATEQVFGSLQSIVETQKTTVVAVTHDMDLASRMQRRIHLVDGKIDYDRVQ